MKKKSNANKRKQKAPPQALEAEESSLKELADLILDDLNQPKLGIDPLDGYARRLQKRLYVDSQGFYSKFTQGYETLLKELKAS